MSLKGKILAIDYGVRHLGLAVSDYNRQMAFGRGTLLNSWDKNKQDQLFRRILEICREESVSMLLIGLPLSIDGGETAQTLKIRDFSELIAEYLESNGFNVPIQFIDESFSSTEARNTLAGLGVKGSDMKSTEDEMAAIILIHRFIDFKP